MMEAKLNETDLKNLISAVDAWEASMSMGKGMGELFAAVLVPDEVKKSSEYKEKVEAMEKEFKEKKAVRRETATLLKAKLILMSQDMAIEKLRTTS